MRRILTVLAIVCLSHSAFAHDMITFKSKACASIQDACKNAGYTGNDGDSKRFWKDCMGPILMGRSVGGVKVEATVVKQCRSDKMVQLKDELKDLQKAAKK